MRVIEPKSPVRAKRWMVVLRFAMAGAAVGLLVGLSEGGALYFVPRFPGLSHPDIRFLIWFVAPLSDGLFGGLVGLVLGLLAVAANYASPLTDAGIAAGGLGFAAVYAGWAVRWIPWRGAGWRSSLVQTGPAIVFAVVFVSALIVLATHGNRMRRFRAKEIQWPLGLPAWLVALAMAVSVSGLVVYQAVRPVARSRDATAAVPSSRSPNIVLITLDAGRADHLSTYGYARPTTPNLDRLARGGVLFENAVAPSSWTVPSHVSIFTGLLPHQHGSGWFSASDQSLWTLARVLKSRGYETAGFTSNYHFGESGWGLGEGFEFYEDDSSSIRHHLAATVVGHRLLQPLYEHWVKYDIFDRRDAEQVNRDVFRWLRRRSNRPFLVFINYYDTHDPYQAPRPYGRRFGQVSEGVLRRFNELVRSPEGFSPEERASIVNGYDDCLSYLDEEVGQLVQFLTGTSAERNTILIVTSDHGEGFGEHGTYTHPWNLYWPVLHVPLIFYGAGVPAGRRIRQTVSTMDIFSTVLNLALVGERPFRETSLSRFWMLGTEEGGPDRPALSELISPPPDLRPVLISLATSEWHYIQDSRGRVELYHWPTDPLELMDLSRSPQHAETLETLRHRLYREIALSFRPWRDTDYLLAFDRPGHSSLRDLSLGVGLGSNELPFQFRVGWPQVYFGSARFESPASLRPEDKDLIQSLPYHE